MNKVEFLDALHQRIDMLDDAEVSDILNEYSLHIECKVKCGMTEEEAVEDFGDVAELAADILGAYHVKASASGFSSNTSFAGASSANASSANDSPAGCSSTMENGGDDFADDPGIHPAYASFGEGISNAATGIVAPLWKMISSGVDKVASLVSRGCKAVGAAIVRIGAAFFGGKAAQTESPAGAAKASSSAEAACGPFADVSCESSTNDVCGSSTGTACEVLGASKPEGLLVRCWKRFWSLVLGAFRMLFRACVWAVKVCVLLAIGFVLLVLALAAATSVFFLGLGLVLVALGYPLIGVTLSLLGASAMGASLCAAAFYLLRRQLSKFRSAESKNCPVEDGMLAGEVVKSYA